MIPQTAPELAAGGEPVELAAAESAAATELKHGRYDANQRRQSLRRGRERGCWLYVPAEELEKAGYPLGSDPPYYRVWGSRSGGVFARLYRDR